MLDLLFTTRKKKAGVVVAYADFIAYLNKNVPTTLPAGNSPQAASGYRQTTLNIVDQGSMWGTPWMNFFTYDSILIRVARHAFPDKVTADENIITSKRVVAAKYVYQGSRAAYQGVNRNGYLSSSYSTFNGQQMTDFIYWDAVKGQVMRLNPFLGDNPVPFDGLLK